MSGIGSPEARSAPILPNLKLSIWKWFCALLILMAAVAALEQL